MECKEDNTKRTAVIFAASDAEVSGWCRSKYSKYASDLGPVSDSRAYVIPYRKVKEETDGKLKSIAETIGPADTKSSRRVQPLVA